MSSFLCSVIRLTRKSCLCVHAASPPQRGFEAVLTRQWFEWCVCTVVFCLSATIQTFWWLTAYQFQPCRGSRCSRGFWLAVLEFEPVWWRDLYVLAPRWSFSDSEHRVNPTCRRSPGVALPVCFCVMSRHQMLQQNRPPLKMKAGPSLIAAGGGPFYGAPRKSQRLSLKRLWGFPIQQISVCWFK